MSFRITNPDGSKTTDSWDDKWKVGTDACFGWYDDAKYTGKTGKMKIEVFATDDSGKKILAGEKTIKIVK
ncbi:MAG: hypothetical protein ACI4QE_05010 [Acutalibacteraceae bacterium]